MARLDSHDWVEIHLGELRVVDGRAIVPLTWTLTGAFYAFRDALMYSVHKYASCLDWSVLDEIEC
jgi:hypothetical protein